MEDFEFPLEAPTRAFVKPERIMSPKEKELRSLIKESGFPEASAELDLRDCELSVDKLISIWQNYKKTGQTFVWE